MWCLPNSARNEASRDEGSFNGGHGIRSECSKLMNVMKL